MSLIMKIKVARIEGEAAPDDAESLLAWLLDHPKGKLNLKNCSNLHSAVLQVIMVFRPAISVWPDNINIKHILQAAGLSDR